MLLVGSPRLVVMGPGNPRVLASTYPAGMLAAFGQTAFVLNETRENLRSSCSMVWGRCTDLVCLALVGYFHGNCS